jgi:hypothetical protein
MYFTGSCHRKETIQIRYTANMSLKFFSLHRGKNINSYEFGNQSSFAYTRKSGIIVGAMAIDGNAYYGHTLKPK